ncbi:MAG: DUF996 domain-containing protein [Thermoplasmatales archaeon]|nr:MAG: DUF996 domain-containing protein [Thermoplasmatales archaeon]
MVELSNAKVFGGIGALLMLIGTFIPTIGPILSIAGIVLIFIAVKTISELTKDNEIYRNYLMHLIISVIAIVALFVIMLVAFGAAGGFTWISGLETTEITDFESFWANFGSIIGGCAVALIVGWILSILAAIYLRRSYNKIAEHTKVDLFKTTGTVYFVGAITTIVLIGLLIIIIARIIEIIAFFSLPDKLPEAVGGEKKEPDRRCPNCGRAIPMDAKACPYCAKKFEE